MSTARWTDRYRDRDTAVLVDNGEVVEVEVVRVTNARVIVKREGEELRYAADATDSCPFMSGMRDRRNRVIPGAHPMLALPGDHLVTLVQKKREVKLKRDRKAARLRKRVEELVAGADLDGLERALVALEEPREDFDTRDIPELETLVGGASMSRAQRKAAWKIVQQMNERAAAAHKDGFARGQNLLAGLNDGTYTPETFEDRRKHEQYRVNLAVERWRAGGERDGD